MFFFPFRTDAPIYYWPLATVGLIALNIAIPFALATGQISSPNEWILWYGQGLHPQQWLSSMFLHTGPGHLLGNMLFLWVFGLVVEGKLGWWKFLACYLALGIAQAMVQQTVMLGYNGAVPGSVGASGAIFGLMALALVWAPKNNISIGYLIFLFPFFRAGVFDVTILAMAAFYVGMETLSLLVSGGTYGSGWLHLCGFAIGVPLAVVLLKHKVVDCEGWDFFHVWRGDYGLLKEESDAPLASEPPADRPQHQQTQHMADAKGQLRAFLRAGNVAAATLFYSKMKEGGLVLDRDELVAIIHGLHTAKRWAESAPLMAELIERFPDGADPVRVKLAQICVVELERPGKALDLLATVNLAKLPPRQVPLAKQTAAKAQQMRMQGIVELETDAW